MKIIEERIIFSKEKLANLAERISKIEYIDSLKENLCIYATGSFAREEASPYSDLDIFLICKGKRISNIQEILLKADLINIIRQLALPDFSGDGEFLTIHTVEDILDVLGSPGDDYKNCFTARMLLLLESKPLYNQNLYEKIMLEIIDVYFKEYPEHEKSFSPLFLANDIIRFWKTMCLNYEHKRNKSNSDSESKNKARIKNLKLKFSRLTTCYSLLCSFKEGVKSTPDQLYKLCLLTPTERLLSLKENSKEAAKLINDMIELYSWFLAVTGNDQKSLYKWIGEGKNKDMGFEKAKEYHDLFYKLLESTSKNLLKFYTI